MSNVYVTFGRALGSPPVLVGDNRRTEIIAIGGTATSGTLVCDAGSHHQENTADILAEAACWVEIGQNPTATPPGTDPDTTSFYMAAAERLQFSIVKGDKVSVIQA